MKLAFRNQEIFFFGAIYYVLVTVGMEWMIMKTTTFLGFPEDDSDMDVRYGHSLRRGCVSQNLCHDDISLLSGDGAGLVLRHCSSGWCVISKSQWSVTIN
jgi:hypothetical protein